MRKLLTAIMLLAACTAAHAQLDTLEITDEYLDTVNVAGPKEINDYSMIGVNYGVTFSNMIFSPSKHYREFLFKPHYLSVMFTHYEKMFEYLPYFGFTAGFSYSHEGVAFKNDSKTGEPMGNVDGASKISIQTFEVPFLAQIHADFSPAKLLVIIGPYAGWRKSIERSGPYVPEEYTNSFRDYEYRFDYGMEGGAGFGLMFDPIEIHFNILARWSWQSLYKPDYYSEYYYRFANPIDIHATVGVYYQITKRTGRTSASLKKQARDIVYGTKDKNDQGQDR